MSNSPYDTLKKKGMRPLFEGGSIAPNELRPIRIEGVLGFTIENPTGQTNTIYVEASNSKDGVCPIVPGDSRTFGESELREWRGELYLHIGSASQANAFLVIKTVERD
jgi:hypothetical protein